MKMNTRNNIPEDSLTDRGENVAPDTPQASRVVRGKEIEVVLQRAVNEALLTHKRAGNSVAIWRDGKVVLVPAEEIPVADNTTAHTPAEPRTLPEVFKRAVRQHNKPDALNYKLDGVWRSISSDEMLARARAIALGLYSLGVRRGDHIALLSENCPEWTLTDAGCQFVGAVDIPIHSMEKPEQVRDVLNHTRARVLFIQNRTAFERIAETIRDFTALEYIVFFAKQGSKEASALTLAELEARGRALDLEQLTLAEELARAIRPHDLATIIYTSGTTGEPQGVMLTHSNLVTNLIGCSDYLAPFLVPSEEQRVLSVLPLSHALERFAMYEYIHQGMSVYYAESVDFDHPSASKKICNNLREVQPTVMVGVPRIFKKIYAHIKDKAAEEWRAEVGGRIRLFISGEGPLPENIERDFIKRAKLPIVQGYGLTEASPVIAVRTPEENKEHLIGTVGRPIRNVEVRIDADTKEILVRGPNVMHGYYNNPDATREAFTSNGWLKTGDIGRLDDEGYLHITGRMIEIIVTTDGTSINPQPIEQRIKQSPFVNEVVLVGAGRPSLSMLIVPDFEQVQAFAKFKGIKGHTPRELYNHPSIRKLFQSQIDSLTGEPIERIALLENELTIQGGELTPTLKVKRQVVEEKYHDVIDSLYKAA